MSTNESRKCRTLCPKSRQCLVKATCGRLYSTCSTTLNWVISRARCVTSCPGFAPLQRNVHLASLDQCASSGLCRNTVSLTLPETPFVRASDPVSTSGTSDRALSLSTIKHVVVFTQDLFSFSESHATQMDEDQQYVAWSHDSESRASRIGKIVKQRADLIGRRNIWIDMMRFWQMMRVPPFHQNSHA